MQGFAVSFLLGNFFLLLWQRLPNSSIPLVLLILAAVLSAICYWQKIPAVRFIFGAALGFSWTWLIAGQQWQQIVTADLAGKNLLARGVIASVPEQLNNAQRFQFKIQQLSCNSVLIKNPGLVRLTWANQKLLLKPGDQWQLTIRLKPPHATFNPGAFDYEAWLFSHRIHAQGYVIPSGNNQLLRVNSSFSGLDRVRQKLNTAIQEDLNQNPYTGFITALSVGMRDQITPDQWQTMQNTGTNHLMAIAGLHIGLVSGFAFWLMSFGWRRSEKLMLECPAPIAAAYAALIAGVLFSALAGFSLPAQRASIMLLVLLLAVILRRKLPRWHAYSLALLFVLIWDPLSPLDPSFWLSFGAVALILYGMQNCSDQQPLKSKFYHFVSIQWLLTMGLIPLTLIFFQEISLAGFVANLIAIPSIGFVVLPLCLLGVIIWPVLPFLAAKIWYFAALICSWVWPILSKLGEISFLQWHANPNHTIALMILTVGVLILLHPKLSMKRCLGLLAFIPIFIWPTATPKAGEVWFTLLDVGEGLASVIQTQHHVLIYDTGPRFSPNDDAGKATVIPFLRTRDIKVVDMMVVSHSDEDHSGGANSILQAMPVHQILTSIPSLFPKNNAAYCMAEQTWNWDGVQFAFLYPPANQPYADNNSSCVLKITTGSKSLLLTGDIERESEDYLVTNNFNQLASAIIIAPHHGSSTSSSANFIEAVKPIYVLFPVGFLNRFRFPNPKVIARYQQINAQMYATSNLGAIFFDIFPNQILPPKSYREQNRHYWNY